MPPSIPFFTELTPTHLEAQGRGPIMIILETLPFCSHSTQLRTYKLKSILLPLIYCLWVWPCLIWNLHGKTGKGSDGHSTDICIMSKYMNKMSRWMCLRLFSASRWKGGIFTSRTAPEVRGSLKSGFRELMVPTEVSHELPSWAHSFRGHTPHPTKPAFFFLLTRTAWTPFQWGQVSDTVSIWGLINMHLWQTDRMD